MIAGIILTALTGVASCAQFIHRQSQSLVGFDTQSAKRHSTCYKMLNNALHRLYLIQRCWLHSLLESEEVTDKDRLLLLVHHSRPLLKLLV